jgi:ABC-2 type transport system permease protein
MAPRSLHESSLTGSWALLRFTLRRDRLRLPIWAASIAAMFAYAAFGLTGVYPTAADRALRAALMANPAGVMLSGPGYGTEPVHGVVSYTLGAMIANEMVLSLTVAVALMSIQLVIRHTRAEEEAGRTDLVRAGVVGRHAPAAAALLDALVANAVIALLSGVTLISAGLSTTDSLAVGIGIGVTGLVFASIAAVTAQVTEHARSAAGMAYAVLGATFVVRALGDVARLHGSALSWFSPIAWQQQMRPFVDLRWWPLVPSLALIALAITGAYALASRRDTAAGLLPARSGRPEAAASLSTPAALAVRQQYSSVIAWGVGLFLMAAATGSFMDSMGSMISENPTIEKVFAGGSAADLTDSLLAYMVRFLALGVCAFAVVSFQRLATEETAGRAEPILATAVSRWQWLGRSGLAVTALATVVLLVVSGLGLGLSAGVVLGDLSLVPALVGASLTFVPAVAVVVAVTAVLYGVGPRAVGLAWVVVAFILFTGMFGRLLALPGWLVNLSPFEATPATPSADFNVIPLVLMVAVAVALVAVAARLFRNRDLA